MIERVVALVVDESKWLAVSMMSALLGVALLVVRHRDSERGNRGRVQAAMNLAFAVTIGAMAFGHLLAVTAKLAWGTLEGSAPTFYLIGIALAAPSWWLIYQSRSVRAPGEDQDRRTLWLNAWLVVTLLGLGLHNLPLAAPGLLNIAYHLHSGRVAGWVIVATAVSVNVSLFIGSLIFLASGQSFEQFRGIR